MSQFAINLIWDSSVLAQPNAAQIEASLTSAAQVFASNFSNPVTLNLHVGWGEANGATLGSKTLGQSDPQLIYSPYGQVQSALSGLPAVNPTGGATIGLTDIQAAAIGLSGATTVDGYLGFSATPGEFILNLTDRGGPQSYYLADIFIHEVTEVMGRISNVGGRGSPTSLDLFRYSASGVRSLSPSANAYFSADGGVTNEAAFNSDPKGDSGDWSVAVSSDAFDAFAGVAGYFSQADVDVMTALGWRATSANWDGALINAETEAWLGRPANAGDFYSFASELANGWTPDNIRQQLLGCSEGRAHTDAQVTSLYSNYMGRDPTAAELTAWEGLIFAGDDFSTVRSAILADSYGRAHTDATVTSLYETWFGRAPSTAELSAWEGMIASGKDFTALRMALVADPASFPQIGVDVTSLYDTWFGRDPTASELSAWRGLIAGGDDLAVLRSALISDPAGHTYIAQTVTGLYEKYLFRAPTTAEVSAWQGLFAGGDSFSDLSAALVQVQVQIENTVPGLYQTYMGRQPSAAELSYWDGQVVGAGATTGTIRQAIVSDPAGQAYIAAGVTSLYDTWFGRDPIPAELSAWNGLMAGGDDFSTLRAALIADPAGRAFIAETVTGFYETLLSRAPNIYELQTAQYSVAGGQSLSDVDFSLALSQARLSIPPYVTDKDVTNLYVTYDGRPPTAAELAAIALSYSGASVPNPRAAVLGSAEAQTFLTQQVTVLYDTYFGRDPTAHELGSWRTAIDDQGDNYKTVRATLLLLPAGQAHTTAEIKLLYDTYFGRDPSTSDTAAWQNVIVNGGYDFTAMRAFLLADPAGQAHTTAEIKFLYDTYFGRDPSASDTAAWQNVIVNGGYDFNGMRAFLLADSAGQAHTTAEIKLLYDTYFGREPNASDTAAWQNVIVNGGYDFNGMRAFLLADPAGQAHTSATITSLYDTYFGRDPQASELAAWQGLIDSGYDFNGLRTALLNDPTGVAHTNATTISLYDTYFGRDPQGSELTAWQGLIASGFDFYQMRDVLERDPGSNAVVTHLDAAGLASITPPAAAAVTIANFNPATSQIDLSAALYPGLNPLDAAHARQIASPYGGSDVLIALDAGHSLLLEHVTLSSLHAGDFLFG